MAKNMFGENVFSKAFQAFDEDAFFEKLHDKVRNKPYFEQYKNFKNTVVWLSYLFNIASALTASYAVYWLTERLTGVAVIGFIVAVVFLFFLEKIKRKSSAEFWQVYFFKKEFATGWFGLSVFCLLISLASSGFGVKQGTEQLAPDAALIATDSLANTYRGEIAQLEAENKELKKQRNHEGIIFYRVQSSIKANKKMIADYQTRILDLDKQLQGKNEQLSEAYAADVKLTAWTLVWLTLFMELLFEACIAYINYFLMRSYIERKLIQEKTNADQDQIATPLPHREDLQAMVLTLQNELETLKASKFENNSQSLNGQLRDKAFENNGKKPLGFFTDKQLASMRLSTPNHENASVQACTGLYRDDLTDKYTVQHTYSKFGKKHKVHYTLAQVQARIAQYMREAQEAIDKNLDIAVQENRQKWLIYWQSKEKELLKKLDKKAIPTKV